MDKKTSRRTLLRAATLGGIAAGAGVAGKNTSFVGEAHAQHRSGSVPLLGQQATVAFGAWQGDQGWDRTSPSFNPIRANDHTVAPRHVVIRAGGLVSYVLSGFHQLIVYDKGTKPEDINTENLVLSEGPGAPPFPILIDDPNRRIFRGADPGGLPLDRVENIHFSQPGTYLVICGVIFHFRDDDMFGWVTVVP